jgi:arylsulfatase A-like enzyme
MKRILFLYFLLSGICQTHAQQTPNIIYIMADDLGYGELGCYGQQKIKTPNIDQLAGQGMRFTQFYATTLCASTRCSFITGLSGAQAQVRDNHELGGYKDEEEFGQMPLSPNTNTIATALKKAGYTTAVIGKWGMGGPGSTGIPNKQGFDFFYGYLDQKQAHNFYPSHLWRNEKAEWLQPYFSPHQKFTGDSTNPKDYDKYKGKIFSQDTMAAEAIKFISSNKKNPFFLYLTFTLPHLSLQVPDAELKQYENRFTEKPKQGLFASYQTTQRLCSHDFYTG